jgi:TM2 domain-containing membrane protein YozV
MNCTNHPDVQAMGSCSKCGKPLCGHCTIRIGGNPFCKQCLEVADANRGRPGRVGKSPALAGLLSGIIPGSGQVYVGYYVTGFIYILAFAGIISVLSSNAGRGGEPFFGIFLGFFYVFNIVDAARRAKQYNRLYRGEAEEKLPTDSPLIGGIVLVAIGLILTLEITLDMDLDFLSNIWPLAILVTGLYLLWKFKRTKDELRSGGGDMGSASTKGSAGGMGPGNRGGGGTGGTGGGGPQDLPPPPGPTVWTGRREPDTNE